MSFLILTLLARWGGVNNVYLLFTTKCSLPLSLFPPRYLWITRNYCYSPGPYRKQRQIFNEGLIVKGILNKQTPHWFLFHLLIYLKYIPPLLTLFLKTAFHYLQCWQWKREQHRPTSVSDKPRECATDVSKLPGLESGPEQGLLLKLTTS